MFITDVILAPPDNQNIVVGMWDNLDDNNDFYPYNETDDFLIQLMAPKIINSNYIVISNSNTTISLLKAGLYKISCIIDLAALGDTYRYLGQIIEDSITDEFIFYHLHTSDSITFYQAITTFYIQPDGSHSYQFRIYSTDDSDFQISSGNELYNQFVIEYVRS